MQGTTNYNKISECYVLLNLDPAITLTTERLSRSYKSAAVKYHPDRNIGRDVGNVMTLVNEAKTTLQPLSQVNFILVDEMAKTQEALREANVRESERLARERDYLAQEAERLRREGERLEKEQQCMAEERERERLAMEFADQERFLQELMEQERLERQKEHYAQRRTAIRINRRRRNERFSERFLKEENDKREWLAISKKFQEDAKLNEKKNKLGEILDESHRVYQERMKEFDVEIADIRVLYDKAREDYKFDLITYQNEKKVNSYARPPKEIPSWDIPLEKWEKRKKNFVDYHESVYRRKINLIEKEYRDV